MKTTTLLLSAALLFMPGLAQADDGNGMHDMGDMKGMHDMHDKKPAAAPKNEAAAAFGAVNAKMHKDMTMEMTGDADVDFMKGMIPHHQGAIDMAEIQLRFGKDERLRRLAQGIIVEQRQEIAVMQRILGETPAPKPTAAPAPAQGHANHSHMEKKP